jgi:hypothetical protein
MSHPYNLAEGGLCVDALEFGRLDDSLILLDFPTSFVISKGKISSKTKSLFDRESA